MAHRPRPHVNIPLGTAPFNPSPSVHDPPLSPINLWADRRHPILPSDPPASPSNTTSSLPGPRISLDDPARPPSRAASAYEVETTRFSFTESQLYRSSSQRSSYRAASNLTHRSTRSDSLLTPDSILTPTQYQYSIRGESRPPSFINTPESTTRDLSSELSDLTIDSEEGLRKFQSRQLKESDEEWYRLLPPEAREVLDKKEVQRQSVLFEIIKSERDYVSDLELVKEVFIDPLVNTLAVPQHRVDGFVHEVFYNLDKILAHHQHMLGVLFSRQQDQFPLVQSIADIVLDNTLRFRADYEEYIKHYPIAVNRHRSEMRRSQRYQYFLQQCALDPRVRKRDIITFISRPVTRLPRLLLLLENMKKYTEADHPDMDTIPLTLGILNEFIKSTQPGIEAAEEKVRFWSLCESLVYQKGEIIDLDLYDPSRSLMHQGPLSRRYKSEMNYHWADLHVALLDNYLLLLKPEMRQSDARSATFTKHHVVSRPIPLEYLRLGMFESPPENRKEKAEDGGLALLERVRPRYRQMFPFTIYHGSARMARRYTLYASSEAERENWLAAFNNAQEMRRFRQDNNMFYVAVPLNDGFFQHATYVLNSGRISSSSYCTGPVAAVTQFSSNSHNFISVACSSGVFVTQRAEPAFRKVLNVTNPSCLVAISDVNKFFVLHDEGLYAYSLDLIGRAALGVTTTQSVEASKERVATEVIFFRAGRVGTRLIVLYAARSLLQATLYALEMVENAESSTSRRRSMNGLFSLRSFGEPLSISRDTHNVTVLNRRIVICSEKGISLADPANLSLSTKSKSLPDFREADISNHLPMLALKSRCLSSKPLGVIRCDGSDELMIVYDEIGCYTDRYGIPSRYCGYLRWETRAETYSHRGAHVLLFSPEFIEIRTVQTGKLVQVIEGEGIRRVDVGLLSPDTDSATVIAIKGREEQGMVVDMVQELVETTELTTRASDVPGMFDDFDVA